eukprot:CAMPEP_0174923290 /NCGR_PEP_ID=MMETSP1355-20121228/6484_1 /TAXON_ID=464990 /ORGANISM="Hemiselmis tepida, Strain CCMP443" /LENGTH=55 /DNA_ID=CAMNT_0016168959 /DNA_START=1 /DNA_END=164 /DNA_ORIENTATION=-
MMVAPRGGESVASTQSPSPTKKRAHTKTLQPHRASNPRAGGGAATPILPPNTPAP